MFRPVTRNRAQGGQIFCLLTELPTLKTVNIFVSSQNLNFFYARVRGAPRIWKSECGPQPGVWGETLSHWRLRGSGDVASCQRILRFSRKKKNTHFNMLFIKKGLQRVQSWTMQKYFCSSCLKVESCVK